MPFYSILYRALVVPLILYSPTTLIAPPTLLFFFYMMNLLYLYIHEWGRRRPHPSIRPLFSLTRRSSGGFQCAFQTVTGETIASFCLCAGLFEFREREKEGAGGSSRIYIIRRRTSFDTIDGTHTFAH
jgi:hypothetical protein